MANHTMGFHPAMHPLLRDGRKTQTRRVVEGVGVGGVATGKMIHGSTTPSGFRCEEFLTDYGLSYSVLCDYEIGDTITVEGTDIRLTVTAIRCERLNDISEEDALAEGVWKSGDDTHPYLCHDLTQDGYSWACSTAMGAFESVWQDLYPDGPKSWTANPAVWVVEFERLEKEDE